MIVGRHPVQFFGPVRANRDDLVSKRAQLFFDCDKIRQMGVAIRTPGTSIEHQHSGFSGDKRVQSHFLAVQIEQVGIRSSRTYRNRLGIFGPSGNLGGAVSMS